jgi:signal transduction histidine kinase/CheY-like chemotaxis protein
MAANVTAQRSATPTHPRQDYYAGLDELRGEAVLLVLCGLLVLAWGIFAAMAGLFHSADPRGFQLILGLLVSVVVTYKARSIGTRLASCLLTAGLFLTVTASLLIYPSGATAPLLALVVLLAAYLLGWPAGLGMAGLGTGAILLLDQPTGADPLSISIVSQVFLIWATVGLTWLLSRPLQLALDWSWNSYLEYLQKTEELRDRQGELVRLSESLNVALDRLERLTEELERARRSAEHANELKSQFAIAISHELRTPLNIIIGFSEMMVLSPESAYGEKLAESYRGDLEAIYCNACHLSNLCDDVLDLSQVEAHRLALQKEWTSLPKVVDEATTALATMVKDKRLQLRVDLPVDLPSLFIDPVRIRQVLINLLVNATRFTDQGGITVGVRAATDEVVVSVSDTGIGIAPEDVSHLFQNFQQIGITGARRGGSGVGLAVSKRLVELHGGSMWVESQLGEGSTFVFSLPRRETVIATPIEPDWKSRTSPVIEPCTAPTVIVVDGEGDATRIFQRYLDGYRVIGTTNLEEARRFTRDHTVRVLVVDSREEEQAWRQLDSRRSPALEIPVVICPLHLRRGQISQLGVVDYLVKPVSRDSLRRALRKLGKKMPASLLLVDDDTEILRLFTRAVRSFSSTCQVWSAHDGVQALATLRERQPDAVLLDLLMPGIDGYAVLETMRQEAGLKDIPVIVVTGWGTNDQAIVAQGITITRPGGLTVGQAMCALKGGLDSLLAAP